MMIKDSAIAECVQKLADHFNTNIATRFLRPLLAGILADNELSRHISDLTDHADMFSSQGTHIDELYQQIIAMARFVYLVRIDVLPNIRHLGGSSSAQDVNKVFRDMAVNNFGANMKVLADIVNELYVLTINYDRLNSPKGGRPVYKGIPALDEIGRYLISR